MYGKANLIEMCAMVDRLNTGSVFVIFGSDISQLTWVSLGLRFPEQVQTMKRE